MAGGWGKEENRGNDFMITFGTPTLRIQFHGDQVMCAGKMGDTHVVAFFNIPKGEPGVKVKVPQRTPDVWFEFAHVKSIDSVLEALKACKRQLQAEKKASSTSRRKRSPTKELVKDENQRPDSQNEK